MNCASGQTGALHPSPVFMSVKFESYAEKKAVGRRASLKTMAFPKISSNKLIDQVVV
jgi:hypothetical protein